MLQPLVILEIVQMTRQQVSTILHLLITVRAAVLRMWRPLALRQIVQMLQGVNTIPRLQRRVQTAGT